MVDFLACFGLSYLIIGVWFFAFSVLDIRDKAEIRLRDAVLISFPIAWAVVVLFWPLYVRTSLSEGLDR